MRKTATNNKLPARNATAAWNATLLIDPRNLMMLPPMCSVSHVTNWTFAGLFLWGQAQVAESALELLVRDTLRKR